jgi:predicted RNA binding protein YcfA (HicA-like mRNA interferase family)
VTRYSAISGKTLIAALKRIGFDEIRVRGSHHLLKHLDGRTTVVPVHSNETLGPGLLASILNYKTFYEELNGCPTSRFSGRHQRWLLNALAFFPLLILSVRRIGKRRQNLLVASVASAAQRLT